MNSDINDRLTSLLHTLEIQDIKPMSIHSDGLGQMPSQGSELKLEWKQLFANGDPLTPMPDTRVFRPKYEFNVSSQSAVIFKQESVFILAFRVLDAATFDKYWADEELRKVFMEKQLQKTMWPLFRQHVHDGMCRLGMAPVPLPWLM
jgi:hypothetical protein